MLLQFSVENFKSIKKRTVLSLEASQEKGHEDNFVHDKNTNILKTVAFFGANASGKSNIFHALTSAILTIRGSADRQVGDRLELITPFAFDENSIGRPSHFEFVFIAGGRRYVYGFSAIKTQIKTEYLYVYNSSKPTVIFIRDEDGVEDESGNRSSQKYKITQKSLRSKLSPIISRNTVNKLFLSTATVWNCEETRIPMMWFMNSINTYPSNRYDGLLPITGELFEKDSDQSLKRFIKAVLKEADLNISDYEFGTREVPPEQYGYRVAGFKQIDRAKNLVITTVHNFKDDLGNESSYSLDLHDESLGTKNLFFLSPIIKRAFETGETLCIDEFDSSVHPMLLVYLIGLFHNPKVNKANAQLIISVHTLDLLDTKIFRRDQIYFIEKDPKNGVSELYSLDEYKATRKPEDIHKSYMLGRYGAIPFIGNGEELWQ